MLNLRYIGEETDYSVNFKSINENVVEVTGENLPEKETGFIVTRIGDPSAFTGDYSEHKTIYREVEGGFQYSNDGSVYIEPLPKVYFYTNGGGTLEGETMQEVKNYEELSIPTPKANENFEFTEWIPEIPESGAIEEIQYFTAIFTSTLPQPDPEPPLREVVENIEEELTNTQLAMTENFEQGIAMQEELTNAQIAITELYEIILGGA